jgi:hydroxyacylglutathione hydrolase
MLFERIVSRGLAHYSYLIGDKNEATVIDPRRDCDIYEEKASSEGMRIVHIFETHRNEDYIIGSVELASRTGAEIWHADGQWDYAYGQATKDGQTWKVGRLEIQAINTPGHTPGSMSYLLYDSGELPWIVFSGDALFAGDVGRIDLLGVNRASEMASLLYDSVFGRLLPLGDQVIVCPAHGAGSVCGEAIAERLWTTIGLEHRYNPKLQFNTREEFVANLLKDRIERPPYFIRMETLNLKGAPMERLPATRPLSAKDFAAMSKDSFVLDTRMELGFAAAHVPGAQSIWIDGLASFEGWYIPYDKPILLVVEANDPQEATRILIREGYDNIAGFLAGGMLGWHMSGHDSASIETITVQRLCRLLDENETRPVRILDVRSDEELKRDGQIQGAQHIHVTQIPERMKEIGKDGPLYVFCGSGMRSMIAASFLQRYGWENLTVVLGGLAGWKSTKCPTRKLGQRQG